MDIFKNFKYLLILIIYGASLAFFLTINTTIYIIKKILTLIKTIKRTINEKIILFRKGRILKK